MQTPLSPRVRALLHPLRIRIVLTVQGRVLSTGQIVRLLGDIPQATVYRHVRVLLDAGVLVVRETRRVHGADERFLALQEAADHLAPEEKKQLTPELLLETVGTLAGGIVDATRRYADRPDFDPHRDGVLCRVEAFYADDEELAQLIVALRQATAPRREPTVGADRKRRLVAVFCIPDSAREGEE